MSVRVLAALILALPLCAAAQFGPGGGSRGGRQGGPPGGGPPQEAFDACRDRQTRESCSFSTPRGEMTGVCYNFADQGRMGCVPEGAPLPPGNEEEQPRQEDRPQRSARRRAAPPPEADQGEGTVEITPADAPKALPASKPLLLRDADASARAAVAAPAAPAAAPSAGVAAAQPAPAPPTYQPVPEHVDNSPAPAPAAPQGLPLPLGTLLLIGLGAGSFGAVAAALVMKGRGPARAAPPSALAAGTAGLPRAHNDLAWTGGHVFISHVEEDQDAAVQIAEGLEASGFRTWYYERDALPGSSYLLQTGKAVEDAAAVLVIISPHSISSHQVTKEVIRAHESAKPFIPVLRGIGHAEFQQKNPEWREAMGSAASLQIPSQGAGAIIMRLVAGLGYIRAGGKPPSA